MLPRFARCLLPALLAISAVWTWMFLTVEYSYHGNWTGLFCTGELLPPPAALAHEDIVIFLKSAGYDGQAYHYIAHDPFFEKGLAKSIDAPRLRYRRALVSLLAHFAAMGDDSLIDAALIGVVIAFCGLGVYWLARLALSFGYTAWIGLLFLLAPSVLVSIDRILTDGALAAFCVGFVLYWREKRYGALWLVCMLAAWTRETGAALAGAMSIYFLVQFLVRRFGNAAADPAVPGLWRSVVLSGLFAASTIPALGWAWFCAMHTSPGNSDWLGPIPFQGLVWRMITPSSYALSPRIAMACVIFDFVGVAGILLALWAVWKKARARATDPAAIAIYLYALLIVFLNNHDAWGDVYAFGRTLAPMLVLLALDGFERNPLRAAMPALLMDPRIGLQWGRQIINVARGLAGA